MKLLILTQKVDSNDDVLGFMHGWIAEFAEQCEQVTVICLFKGEYDLPENVKVLSLGKESSKCKIKYLFRFYKYIWQERNNYDKVFVHMNTEYVLLGGLLWRMLKKKISLWYAHGEVSLKLKLASRLSHIIFTSTKSGCRLDSVKVKVVGQGININRFRTNNLEIKNNNFNILTVGRISPVKDYETMIKAMEELNKREVKFVLQIIGGAGLPEQEEYLKKLKKQVNDNNLDQVIKFLGPIPNKNILKYYQEVDLFVNTSHTGSLDKVMLEAMACDLPVVTCNESMKEVLGEYKKYLMFNKKDYKTLSNKIYQIIQLEKGERVELGRKLRDIVKNNHSTKGLIKKIVDILK